jgi:hypothetical protein
MSQWLDKKYINLLSSQLERFQWRGNVGNCKCPLCLESTKHPNKKRGYFFEKENKWFFYCHRCGASMQFPNLLRKLNSSLYNEYKAEWVKENYKQTKQTDFSSEPEKRFGEDNDLNEFLKLEKIWDLSHIHPACEIMKARKIPNEYARIFRYTPAFMEFTNKLIPRKFSDKALRHDEGRIVIPFFDKHGKFHAYQGRSLQEKADVRYISIMLDEDVPMIWGLDRVNLNETVYVFEGVMDALFIPNSLAICGGNFASLRNIVNPDDTVIVFDNEPRSSETKGKIQKAIWEGYNVCIWPKNILSKDVNAMIINENLTSSDVNRIIDNNTYRGLTAQVALTEWSKR